MSVCLSLPVARGLVHRRGALLHLRVQVGAGGAQLQQPRLVIDAGDAPLGVGRSLLHPQPLEQARHARLHRVAQPDRAHAGFVQHRAGDHRHRIGVVEQPGVRRHLLHVAGEVEHHRNGAQGPEDAADAERVGDGLPQPVLLGHVEVDHRTRLVAAHLDGVDHEIGAAQCFLARVGAQVGLDGGARCVDVAVQRVQHRLRLLAGAGD